MKRELAEFWAEYRDSFTFYFCATLLTATIIVTLVFWVTFPLVLSLYISAWFMLLYLLVIPGLLTAAAVCSGRGWI